MARMRIKVPEQARQASHVRVRAPAPVRVSVQRSIICTTKTLDTPSQTRNLASTSNAPLLYSVRNAQAQEGAVLHRSAAMGFRQGSKYTM